MRREDVLSYLRRDRSLVDASRVAFWSQRARAYGPADGIRVADELRRECIALHPDWPSREDRAADLANHERVSALLRRARSPRTV